MKVTIKRWHAIAQWRWDTGTGTDSQGNPNASMEENDGEEGVCGICRVPYEGCCPACKVPGDDCPLSECPSRFRLCNLSADYGISPAVWGECTHVFHMHCLLKWIGTAASKHQCPMDRRPWGEHIVFFLSPFSFDFDRSVIDIDVVCPNIFQKMF